MLYNAGVKLLTNSGGVIDAMELLTKAGIDLIACGTCVEYYGIKDEISVGRVSNMQEIVKIMTTAKDVVTI
ncbi:MAG: DsrE family protein [Pseudomonadota bacterium]